MLLSVGKKEKKEKEKTYLLFIEMAQNDHVEEIYKIINKSIAYPKLSEEVLFNVIHTYYLWNEGGWLQSI